MVLPGNVCFAKVKGYVPWPARVNILPKDVKVPSGKVPVFFYGTHQVSYVTENDIYDYEKSKEIYGSYKEKNERFNKGMEEMKSNPTILQLGIDKAAIKYLSQFYKFDLEKAETDYKNATEDSFKYTIQPKPIQINRKRRISTTNDINSKKLKMASILSPIKSDLCIELHKLDMMSFQSSTGNADFEAERDKLKTAVIVSDEKIRNDDLDVKPVNQIVADEIVGQPTVDNPGTQPKDDDIPKLTQDDTFENKLIDDKIHTQPIEDRTEIDSLDEKTDSQSEDYKAESTYLEDSTYFPRRSEKISELKSNLSEISNADPVKKATKNVSSFKSPIENIEIGRPMRASAIRFKESLRMFSHELSHKSDVPVHVVKAKVSHKAKEDKINRNNSTHRAKKIKEPVSSANIIPAVCHPQPVPVVINEEEINLRIVSQLSVIDKEIKRTLVVGNENYDLCRKLMKKLNDMKNINLVFLCKVPEIVITMRKCRRYKKDDSIKSIASELYQRFYQIYDKADIDEKIESGAELLKRDSGTCKSAQTLMDEIFVSDSKSQSGSRHSIPSIALSSPSSAVSHQSSSANTPLLPVEPSEPVIQLDQIIGNINELLANGSMELIESYEADKGFVFPFNDDSDRKMDFEGCMDAYEKLGL